MEYYNMDDHADEDLTDKERWIKEAEAVIKDIIHHVKVIEVSKALPNTNRTIYLNMTTLEDKQFCVEMSGNGFQIVGQKYDDASVPTDTFYETPYSLLNSMSVHFKDSFGNELIHKLNTLIERGED